jgi:hypothetical protein
VSPLRLRLNGNSQKSGVVEHKPRAGLEDKRIKTELLGLNSKDNNQNIIKLRNSPPPVKIQNNNTVIKINSFKRMSTEASPTRVGSYLGNKSSKRKLSQKKSTSSKDHPSDTKHAKGNINDLGFG